MNEEIKMVPHDIDLERSVLGGMLLGRGSCMIGMELLIDEVFYKRENELIFQSIKRISNDGKDPDQVLLIEDLKKRKEFNRVGLDNILRISERSCSEYQMEEYCLILREKLMGRKFIEFGSMISQKGYDQSEDVFEVLENMSDKVYEIQNIGSIKSEVTNEDLAMELVDKMKEAKVKKGITGIRSGFSVQDDITGGWQRTDFIVLAARPGMGKTAKALSDLLNMVVKFNQKVIFFSLEMSGIQLFRRLASMYMGIDQEKIKRGDLSQDEWKIFNSKIGDLMNDNLIIVDDCYSVQEIRNRAKKERMKGGLDCIIVDYIQICEGKGQNRENEISYISRSFKKLAKEMNVPLIGLSQLSRKVDERGDKRPKLSDLRESGAIEQDADIVCFLYRPKYYHEEEDDRAYLIIAKHRNGELIDVRMRYVADKVRFVDWEDKPF